MTTETPDQTLLLTVEDGIARITINRPEARNAFTFEMYEKLAEACETANADSSVRALIITGAGERAFSAGTDISLFRAFQKPEDAIGYESFMERVLSAIETCRVPTIAAIAGACTGGGGAIAACCDLRIGTANAKFGIPIARTLGNCLSVTNLARLSALIGVARVKHMILTARLIEADEALAIGLLNEVVSDRAALDARATELAAEIASFAPLTLRATKEGLRRVLAAKRQADDQDLILMCYMSEDFREGMAAFLAKRTPDWSGR
ncbi:enoyl-CoA hydratase/isomerase family protein [Rhodomicrobium vannielii ATCC 17100]|uniref:enoyl-CoA hydratase/isomerase family protein n=1 Tax=Rhodomicrobium vannielii TaxID=1069 RepID=UPI001917C733|nr:enoyl-CoA hydratase/isomerase family protein [Rhodomicrobium vannielii]MBJ7533092.1 enoyl-CoA hydratase/isomerase family protein [Rhodomicrobium vannielii ATCC 17100]